MFTCLLMVCSHGLCVNIRGFYSFKYYRVVSSEKFNGLMWSVCTCLRCFCFCRKNNRNLQNYPLFVSDLKFKIVRNGFLVQIEYMYTLSLSLSKKYIVNN
jgi:hypothetical protein